MQIKSQDLLVAFKLVAWAGQRWTYARLAHELGLSASEVHACVKRGVQADLLASMSAAWQAPAPPAGALEEPAAIYRVRARPHRARKPAPPPGVVSDLSAQEVHDNPARVHADHLAEFAVHGARYAFPAQRLPHARGVPTGRGAAPLASWLGAGEGGWVWPHVHGDAQGQGLEPLHPSVPYAAMRDAALYEMLALLDLLRLGEVADHALAVQRLRSRIQGVPGV